MKEGSSRRRMFQAVEAALARKALTPVVLDVHEQTTIADYFVIVSGRSDTHVRAIAAGVDDELRKQGMRPLTVEGLERGHWVLLDYADVIVHVFYEPIREFYDLEGMWDRAPRVEVPEPTVAPETGTGG